MLQVAPCDRATTKEMLALPVVRNATGMLPAILAQAAVIVVAMEVATG